MVAKRPSAAIAAYSFSPCGASVAAICQRRMRFVSAEPEPSVEREKLANQVSASARSERSRARSGIAVRIPRVALPSSAPASAHGARPPPAGPLAERLARPGRPSRSARRRPRRSRAPASATATAHRLSRRRHVETTTGSRSTASRPANARTRTTSRTRIGRYGFAVRSEMPAKPRCHYRRGDADAQPAGAESRHARATAPAPPAPDLGHEGDRADGRAAGSVAALAVPRAVDAGRRLPTGRPRASDPAEAGREGDAHADDAPPRHGARLPRVRGDLPCEPDPSAPAPARGARRGRRLRRRRRAPRGVRRREAALATRAARAARAAEAPDRGPKAVARLVRALGARRPGERPGVVRLALPHGGRHVRAGADVARRGRRLGGRASPPRPALPRRLRAGVAGGRRKVDGHGAERRRPRVCGPPPAGDSATSSAATSSTSLARRCRRRRRPLPLASCRASTTSC